MRLVASPGIQSDMVGLEDPESLTMQFVQQTE